MLNAYRQANQVSLIPACSLRRATIALVIVAGWMVSPSHRPNWRNRPHACSVKKRQPLPAAVYRNDKYPQRTLLAFGQFISGAAAAGKNTVSRPALAAAAMANSNALSQGRNNTNGKVFQALHEHPWQLNVLYEWVLFPQNTNIFFQHFRWGLNDATSQTGLAVPDICGRVVTRSRQRPGLSAHRGAKTVVDDPNQRTGVGQIRPSRISATSHAG